MAEEFDKKLTDTEQDSENMPVSAEETVSNEETKESLEKAIGRLTGELQELEELKNTAEQELAELKESISDLESRRKTAEGDFADAKKRLTDKNAEIAIKQEAFQALDTEYNEKIKVLKNAVSERKKTLETIAAEREKIEKEISGLFNSFQSNLAAERESLSEIYKQTINAANTQLNSAISESKEILKNIQSDAEKCAKTKEKQTKEHLNKLRELYDKEEELRTNRLNDMETEFREKLDELRDEKKNYESLRITNARRENSLNARENGLNDAIEAEVTRRYKSLIDEKKEVEGDRDYYAESYEDVRKELQELKRTVSITEAVDKVALLNELKELKKIVDNLKKQSNSNYLSEEQREKASKYDALARVSEERLVKINDLSAQVENLKCAEGLNRTLNEIVDRYSDRIDELKAQLDKFKKEDYSQDYRKKPIVDVPVFKRIDEDLKVNGELEWLDGIYEGIAREGFKFSKRLIKAFHTCIKTSLWSPITVLAGVSGTGKSELPRLYALYGGFHFLNVPVKPDWDSPASMFGYYNALERKFEAKEIIRGMYQMQADKSTFNNNLAVFLLDEMNLSHVELYFSDMLSKLEENRNRKYYEPVSLNIDLGAGVQPLDLKLTRNMFWVGTMNEDETTKSLSDKVIDRSNIIVFPRPELLVDREFSPSPSLQQVLNLQSWKQWASDDLSSNNEFKLKTEEYRTIVQDINSDLEKGGRALGHRVWQSIQHYMAAHPDVIHAFKNKVGDEEIKKAMDSAFAEAVAFKIMPKLRGIETEGKVRTECLDAIKVTIANKVEDLLKDYELACESAYGVFMWKSGKFLEDKKEDSGDKTN